VGEFVLVCECVEAYEGENCTVLEKLVTEDPFGKFILTGFIL